LVSRITRPRSSRGIDRAPSVTPWYSFTFEPIVVVSPTTTPVAWSMKKARPMRAPGWMSAPLRE